eukprot:353163-Chlamydomonas_euryale.AAC.1
MREGLACRLRTGRMREGLAWKGAGGEVQTWWLGLEAVKRVEGAEGTRGSSGQLVHGWNGRCTLSKRDVSDRHPCPHTPHPSPSPSRSTQFHTKESKIGRSACGQLCGWTKASFVGARAGNCVDTCRRRG